jgi:aldose sugar dehydrogenase
MTNYRLKNRNVKMIFLLISIVSLLCAFQVKAIEFNSGGMSLKVNKVANGLGISWGMVFLTPSKLLVTQRSGSILLLDLKTKVKINLKNTPIVMPDGQGGMLDVALSPNYKLNGWIYFVYVKNVNGQGATVLARAKLKGEKFNSWQELLVTKSRTTTSYHFGSRITFDNRGHVFFGVGDRGKRPNAQNLNNHAGSIIRLNLDGSIPKDNPFVNQNNVLPEIWSYGHRNPQGLVYDFKFNRLWEIEHGPRGGDEINLVKSAANYGWPIISYGKEYWGPISVGESTHREGMEQPIKYYVPSIAPGSLMIYSGDVFSKWKGNLFAGALKLRHLNRVVLSDNGQAVYEERLLESMNERIRALTQSPDGLIYFSTDSGNIYQISPITP